MAVALISKFCLIIWLIQITMVAVRFVKMAFVFTFSLRWQWNKVERLGGVDKTGVLKRECQKADERDEYSWRKNVHTYHCLEEFLKFQIILKEGMTFSVLTKGV